MNRKVIFTREREAATYGLEVFENEVSIERKDGRSYEWCVCVEHFEQMRASDITWVHRGIQPTLSIAALRGCVTYTRGARA